MISRNAKRRIKKVVLWMEVLLILILGAGMGVVLGAFYQMNQLLPPDSALDNYRPPVGTTIYSADGEKLATLAAENRDPVPLDKIPKHMQNAIVAIEDSRFYTHSGLDFQGLARAVWTNVSERDMGQGASTITQQLARNMFLNARKKISRKIKEALFAVQIERNWTKRQILEAYLNQVYFGAGAYGVKSAARIYFNKDLKDLRLEECALLAGLPQRPSDTSPFITMEREGNYKRSKARRDTVLDKMAEQKYIKPEQARIAKARPVKVNRQRPPAVGYFKAKYFVQHVVDQLQQEYRYDEEIIDKAGLTVITTLDWKMQQAAEKAAKSGLERYRRWGRVSEVAMICVDPHTGYIRAMVGGVQEPWEKYQFNCATQALRQPGSAFKFFTYAAAMQRGHGPGTSVPANAAIKMADGTIYSPKNHGTYGGSMSYVQAFQSSVNGAAVNVGKNVGPENVVALAKRLGITAPMGAYYSISLGTCEVTPLQMASAYGVIPARGRLVTPTGILEIRTLEGEKVSEKPRSVDTGLSQHTIDGMNILTQAVVQHGTGRAASGVPGAHGKTGTTEKNTDAWFVGYTPDLATAVWAGNRNNKPMSSRLYGGTICAPIWADFMKQAIVLNPAKRKKPAAAIPLPEPDRRRRRARGTAAPITADENGRNRLTAVVCPESGLLARRSCPDSRKEQFLIGAQPLRRCNVHTSSTRRRRRAAPQPDATPDATTTPDAAPATPGADPPADPQ